MPLANDASRPISASAIHGSRSGVVFLADHSMEAINQVTGFDQHGRGCLDRGNDDHLSKADTIVIAAIEAGVPMLVKARCMIDSFHSMIRKKAAPDLEPWITDADTSLLASFASGIRRDLAAVRAAIVEPWSNGQTEGQITKLKLVKRQMYGRGKLDLLQARLIGAT
jgi:transposase